MDRGEGTIRKLIAALWLGGTAASAAAPPLFETLRWTAPGAEYQALSSQPSACLYIDLQDEAMVFAGQALFNSPTLLGGQAAKAGLNCASCHANGRDNPHFALAGVSDKPGTADVTNSFFSPARGNGRFDPVPIPDLAAPGKISRDPDGKALEPFIRALIVEEFSGREPSPAMLEAIAAYVRAIRSCPGGDKTQVARKLDDQLLIIRAALEGSRKMAMRGDTQAARLLITAARHQLGLISERYAGPKMQRERELLLSASRKLANITDAAGSPEQIDKALNEWMVRFNRQTISALMEKESVSLYDQKRLTSAIKARSKDK